VRRDAVKVAYFILIVAVKVAIPRENMVSFPLLETARNIHPREELVPYIEPRSLLRKQLHSAQNTTRTSHSKFVLRPIAW
jgi:hypothetical protein